LYYDIILVWDSHNARPLLGAEEIIQPILVIQTAWFDTSTPNLLVYIFTSSRIVDQEYNIFNILKITISTTSH